MINRVSQPSFAKGSTIHKLTSLTSRRLVEVCWCGRTDCFLGCWWALVGSPLHVDNLFSLWLSNSHLNEKASGRRDCCCFKCCGCSFSSPQYYLLSCSQAVPGFPLPSLLSSNCTIIHDIEYVNHYTGISVQWECSPRNTHLFTKTDRWTRKLLLKYNLGTIRFNPASSFNLSAHEMSILHAQVTDRYSLLISYLILWKHWHLST